MVSERSPRHRPVPDGGFDKRTKLRIYLFVAAMALLMIGSIMVNR